MYDVVVIGAGPAGMEAARRACELGARTAIVTRDYLGGMGNHDGPIPVRTLAQAARLIREAEHLPRYGVDIQIEKVNYPRLLERVRAVVEEVDKCMNSREYFGGLGITIFEHAGLAHFIDPHTIETENGFHIQGQKFIITGGGQSRLLPIPGIEHTITHSDAWCLRDVPESMVVVGAGATGVQVASIFRAFGCQVSLFEVAPRILSIEDEDVSAAMAAAYRAGGMMVVEGFDGVDEIRRDGNALQFVYRVQGRQHSLRTAAVVLAVGWVANADALNLAAAGVQTSPRGYIQVNEFMQTSAEHIFAAGDIIGQVMLVPSAIQGGYHAASNAVEGLLYPLNYDLIPTGSFTDPEYASVGLTEAAARRAADIVVGVVRFDQFPRSIIDGRTRGFCKLIVDRNTHQFLGAHVVGERAVETVQMVAAGMAAGLKVEDLARIPLSFPTYVGIVGWAAADIVDKLGIELGRAQWEPHRVKV